MPQLFTANTISPDTPGTESLWFIFMGNQLLVDSSAPISGIPQAKQIQDLGVHPLRTQFLGYLGNQPCYSAELSADVGLPSNMQLEGLRGLYPTLGDDLFALAGRAFQIKEWDRTHQYCGACAQPMYQLPGERAKRCSACGLVNYPRLSPAVIMLISREEEILLARAHRFRNGMYSVLAGFVEPGETLEETVAREVKEEVGLDITDIRYFGSQPWPFPNSLMIGFTATYAGGTICPEPEEIADAAWFSPRDLPPIPPKPSIARRLIDWFVAEHGSVV